jgi:uncharacterized protein with GYD domain
MATYIVLISFTEKGAKAIRETTKRADTFRKLGKKVGIKLKEAYWTLGAYDGVCVYEAPGDEEITAFLLDAAEEGFVKTHTLRAFSEGEMKKIIDKMP